MTREEAVLKAGPFYHVTPVECVDRIELQGLVPSYELYETIPGIDGGIVCVSPHRNRRKFLHAIADKSESGSVAIFRIAASHLLDLRLDLDRTNTELSLLQSRLRTSEFSTLLLGGADLMLFDPVPPNHLQRIPFSALDDAWSPT